MELAGCTGNLFVLAGLVNKVKESKMKLVILFPELYYESNYLDSMEEVIKDLRGQDRLAVVTMDILSYFVEIRLEGRGFEPYFTQLIIGKNKISRITKKSKHLDYHNNLDSYFITVYKKKGAKGSKLALDFIDRDEWKDKAAKIWHIKEFSAADKTIKELISFLEKFFSEGAVELFICPKPSKVFTCNEEGQFEMFN